MTPCHHAGSPSLGSFESSRGSRPIGVGDLGFIVVRGKQKGLQELTLVDRTRHHRLCKGDKFTNKQGHGTSLLEERQGIWRSAVE